MKLGRLGVGCFFKTSFDDDIYLNVYVETNGRGGEYGCSLHVTPVLNLKTCAVSNMGIGAEVTQVTLDEVYSFMKGKVKMFKEELAAKLNGISYSDISRKDFRYLKEHGLVVIRGASDDLMEIDGAIRDEGTCYKGGSFLIDKDGILPTFESIKEDYDSTEEDFKNFFEKKAKAKLIKAVRHNEGEYSWTYETDIPHATFDIMDGNDKYCKGIVFDINELRYPPKE